MPGNLIFCGDLTGRALIQNQRLPFYKSRCLELSRSTANFLKTTAKYHQGMWSGFCQVKKFSRDIGNMDTGAAHVAAATNFRSSFDFIPKF